VDEAAAAGSHRSYEGTDQCPIVDLVITGGYQADLDRGAKEWLEFSAVLAGERLDLEAKLNLAMSQLSQFRPIGV
jgi:hypothetical protein